MQLPLPEQLNTQTVLRYLGAAGWTPDDSMQQLLARAEASLRGAATPRGIWRQLPLDALPLEDAGTDLARHLNGCDGMVLMAATLGSGVDTALRRLCLQDIALGAVADAAASVLLEQVCDQFEAEIRQQITEKGLYLTGRYSPGYGDCPLTLQKDFCLALDTVRGIGLCLTPDCLLTPRKSVTAILGTADHPVTGAKAGCANCALRTKCAYRKKGTTCATE